MALGPLIKSALKEVVSSLPEDFAMKSVSVENALIKQGVKPEELKFAKLDLPEGRVTKQDLVRAERMRGGTVTRTNAGKEFSDVTLRGAEDNPTYTEMVYKFDPAEAQKKEINEAGNEVINAHMRGDISAEDAQTMTAQLMQTRSNLPSGYKSSHFTEPNYLMHARTVDQDLNGTPTRTILELQSDLHQKGGRQGYLEQGERRISREEYGQINDAIRSGDVELATSLARRWGYTGELDRDSVIDWSLDRLGYKAIDAPFKSNWLRKLMEFEVARAREDGFSQVAIPLKGAGTESLVRGEGVQTWYESTVRQTAEKLAKATGGTVEYVSSHGPIKLSRVSTDDINTAIDLQKQLRSTDLTSADYDELAANTFSLADSIGIPYSKNEAPETVLWRVRDTINAHLRAQENPAELAAAEANPFNVDYIVIKPGAKSGFSLYAGGGVTALAVADAMQNGYGEDELRQYLQSQGLDATEIDAALKQGQQARAALDQGYSAEEVQGFLDAREPTVTPTAKNSPAMNSWQGVRAAKTAEAYEQAYAQGTPSAPKSLLEAYGADSKTLIARRDAAYNKVTQQEAISAKDLVASLQVLNPAMTSLTTRVHGFAGDQLKQAQVTAVEEASRNKIIAMAKERGIDLEFQDGEYYAKLPNGQYAVVTPSVWDEVVGATGEAVGGIAGAIAGAAFTPVPHPLAKAAGSVVGAAIGAATGSQFDYMYNAIKLSEDMNAQVAANKALTAVELSIVGDAIGYPIARMGSAGIKQLIKAKRFILDGNAEGAYRALKDTMFISDAEAQQLVDKLSQVSVVPGATQTEQRIAATAISRPGAQTLVHAAIASDPKASQALVQSIDARAQNVLSTARSLSGPDTARLLRDDLDNYVADVKQYYGQVKGAVASARPISFDYDKIAIEPVLQQIEKNLTDPVMLERFLSKAKAIRETSDSRTFADLLELRHHVNDFLFNKRMLTVKDKEAIRGVIQRIDGTVEAAARMAMPDGEAWLKQWAAARAKYAQMKRVEETATAKMLRSPTLSEADIGTRLAKHMQSVDGTLETVLTQLPPNARRRAETAVIDTLANKFTAGTEGGLRATNFPLLKAELDKMVFTTKEGREFKAAIGKLADVFSNDAALARASGHVNFTKPQGFLADDVVSKFKYQAAQSIFQESQKLLPTARGRGLALLGKVADLLENPLHAKTIKEVMSDLSPELSEQVRQLQAATARAQAEGRDLGAARVKLFGDGKLLSTKGSGKSVQVPLHRIATEDQIREIAEAEGIALSNTKLLDVALKNRGFVAAMQGSEKARKL